MVDKTIDTVYAANPGIAAAGDRVGASRSGVDIALLVEDIAAINTPQQEAAGYLISGSVTWISGLIFEVSACTYVIAGVTYNSPQATITLDAADGTNPRIDVILVNTSSVAAEQAGTPAASPAKAEVDPATELELTFITVAQSATTPSGVSTTLLYGENAGDPTEWDATESTATVRITLASAADPYAGTNSILFNSAVADDVVTLTAGAGNELSVGDMNSLELHVKVIDWAVKKRLRIAFFNDVTRISNWVEIKDGNFGFDRTNTTTYQSIGILASQFGFTAVTATSMQIQVTGAQAALQTYVDQVRIQQGLTVVNNIVGLTEEQLVNNVRLWNAQQVFPPVTLTDAASITWDMDSPTAIVTLTDNRTLANPTNIRAGGTYYLWVIQDGGGTNTLAYGSAFKFAGGTAPTLTTTGSAVDILTFVSRDGTTLDGVISLDSK